MAKSLDLGMALVLLAVVFTGCPWLTPPAATGSLTVILSPAAVRSLGAWAVDGGAWKASGETAANLTPGEHTVTFKPVTGWTVPASRNIVITAGANVTLKDVYTQSTGEGEGEGEASNIIAAFSITPASGIVPLSVQFMDLSDSIDGDISTWKWDFDNDGSVDSTERNPIHEYEAPGIYTVSLRVQGPAGDDLQTRMNAVVALAGEQQIIGVPGGTVQTEPGSALSVEANVLPYDIQFRIAETSEEAVRGSLSEEVPYAGALTVEARELTTTRTGIHYKNAGVRMQFTVRLHAQHIPGTLLDVYKQGDGLDAWEYMEEKAEVDSSGMNAFFEASMPGTYIVRANDEYSIPSFDFDEIRKASGKELPAPAEPELKKVPDGGNGPIPLVLIHGAGSYKNGVLICYYR